MLTLLVCKAGDVEGQIIARVENSPYVHVALDMGDGWAIAEEAVGLWGRPSSHYGNGVLRRPLPLDSYQEQMVAYWLRTHVGDGYDFVADAIDGMNLVLRARIKIPESGRYNCSGVIAEACWQAGWYPFGDRDPKSIMPPDWATVEIRSSQNGK